MSTQESGFKLSVERCEENRTLDQDAPASGLSNDPRPGIGQSGQVKLEKHDNTQIVRLGLGGLNLIQKCPAGSYSQRWQPDGISSESFILLHRGGSR